eukprot:8136346-Lingulodinium_polyedra.AAC.1
MPSFTRSTKRKTRSLLAAEASRQHNPHLPQTSRCRHGCRQKALAELTTAPRTPTAPRQWHPG